MCGLCVLLHLRLAVRCAVLPVHAPGTVLALMGPAACARRLLPPLTPPPAGTCCYDSCTLTHTAVGPPGTVLALMGPSGSGKTSLLCSVHTLAVL